MKVVYAGYRSWSFQILSSLVSHKNSLWNLTNIITPETTEKDFTKFGIPVHVINPTKKYVNEHIQLANKLKPDVLLYFGWSWYIPEEIYSRYTTLILHTSPLPKYRGGSPLQHQIINGETESAVSIVEVAKDIDTGDIYGQRPFSLKGTLDAIFKRIAREGSRETISVLDAIANKTIQPTKQNEKSATYFPRRKESESEITRKELQTKTAQELYNKIRALADPYPNAYITTHDGKKLFITEAHINETNG